jgi:hypothetical protein
VNNHWLSEPVFLLRTLLAGPATASFSSARRATWTTSCGEGVWLLSASRWPEYKLPILSDFAVATKYIEWLSPGAIALRVPGKLTLDANKLVKPFLRKGSDLKV